MIIFDSKKEYKRVVFERRGNKMVNLDYEITSKTCAVKYKHEKSCIVIEGDSEIFIDKPINKYLNYNCNYFGSSLEGRLKSSQMILGMKYKLPIIIEPVIHGTWKPPLPRTVPAPTSLLFRTA